MTRRDQTDTEARCSRCKEMKPLAEFRPLRSPTSKSGLHSWCNTCYRDWDRVRQQNRRRAERLGLV